MGALVGAILALLVGLGYMTEDQAQGVRDLVPAAPVATAAVGSGAQ